MLLTSAFMRTLRRWCDEEELDLVLTVGGTMPAPGPSGRQIVPDAAAEVAERSLPGLGEAMRAYAQETTDLALIERSAAVIRGRTLILNLPDGAGPATLFLEAVTGVIAPGALTCRNALPLAGRGAGRG